ncbi:hypothetical protein QN277_003870 [Acacia crassicarpa]|uniref:Protein kinase domain-containing protein n=1 Tax=Acacia crassicarpa TaxID=499986 RepID=A0AAE1MD70_9FABA|nr:hypothetical protein QN277_003870 [Acacia crassicarpa]
MVLPVYFFFFFFFSLLADHMLVLSSDSSGECPPSFHCGNLGNLSFPYTTPQRNHCGMLPIHGCEDEHPNGQKTVYFGKEQFQVTGVGNMFNPAVFIRDTDLQKRLEKDDCDVLCCNITLPTSSPLGYFAIGPTIITMYKCNSSLYYNVSSQFLNYTGCAKSNHETIFFRSQDQDHPPPSLATCSRVQLPVNMMTFSPDPFTFIASDFTVNVKLSDDCIRCSDDNMGLCRLNSTGGFYCSKFKDEAEIKHQKKVRAWMLAFRIGFGLGLGLLILALVLIIRLYKQKQSALSDVRLRSTNKQKHRSLKSQNQSRSIESDNTHSRSNEHHNTHSNAIQESRNIYFGVPVFSYEELEEATNKFDQSRQLGRGGFGTVYYGKLKDGREVAVKRLFERNYRGVQQFINEVQILTRLRHRNLVSLYGCTSCSSHELLLVYEYISNGTLGCHLHGNLAKQGSLPWSVRMRIATETANALSYLHACGVIHRDVKSSNLLLDHHFCVKVADFGISRLFPKLVSHVSTCPAGSPGYLDPEYYQFCQLTEKSDVYSFGVVLIELISSKPAIFMRATDKINLANMAVKKIQRSAFSELVDPSLGFESDDKVREMIMSVAKLAFRCVQRDVELRPSMGEVMEFLQKIENGNYDIKHLEFLGAGFLNREIYTFLPTSIHRDEDASLNNSELQHPPPTV